MPRKSSQPANFLRVAVPLLTGLACVGLSAPSALAKPTRRAAHAGKRTPPARPPAITPRRPPPAAAPVTAAPRGVDSATQENESSKVPAPRATVPGKPRVYTFGGMDVNGTLKAPQMLFFRGRVKQELDTSNPEKRSFLGELEKTADADGL